MCGQHTRAKIQAWSDILYDPDRKFTQDSSIETDKLIKNLIARSGRFLYEDLRKAKDIFSSPYDLTKEFRDLTKEERSVWLSLAEEIPLKLKSIHLLIRPFEEFCRTCIITDDEIETLARSDHDCYCLSLKSNNPGKDKKPGPARKTRPAPASFIELSGKRRRFYLEMNYLIPVQLKKCGFEIFRSEEAAEIDEKMISKLARAIHSGYLHKIKKQTPAAPVSGFYRQGNIKNQNFSDFNDLPDEIRYSNIDNAYHIPAKLLAIGYKIRHVSKGFKPFTLNLSAEEIETMARVEHVRWSWDKRLNGWIYGKNRDYASKTHPDLIAYEDLPESAKEKDRELVRLIPALLQDINYEAYPVNPNRIRRLSYAIKPQSSIHKLLIDTRQLNAEISLLASSSPGIEEKLQAINTKIEETIDEVKGNYFYAQHIQEAFLPDDLYIRECFPDSFVLFRPKDIVSGDFYFFHKQDHLVIFAAADCTGHGIPGALLSTIGYGILDQAVTEINLTDPPAILEHLYLKVHRFLRIEDKDCGLSDDMDIALCTLDTVTNILTYSGVSNPLYRVTAGGMIEHKAQNSADIGVRSKTPRFVSEKIRLKTGDTIYIGSDGFTDQFGGLKHKKYQSSRFKSYLMSIQDHPLQEQCDKLYEEFERWRELNDEDQTDDILVIGIRI